MHGDVIYSLWVRNRYIFRSHISEKKFRELIRLFSLDIEASKISVFTGISRKTINKILHAIRVRLAELCEEQAIFSQGVFECDESYFGARRIRGKRGRGAAGKIIVFGIYERYTGRVYTCIAPNVKSQTLIEIIRKKIPLNSTIYTDGFRSYLPLARYGYLKHESIDHGKNEWARNQIHVNGIEGFWGVSKTRMSKFRGLRVSLFSLHLKESEYRFNHWHENLYQLILTNLRKTPLKYSWTKFKKSMDGIIF